jgi:hypothetical protein
MRQLQIFTIDRNELRDVGEDKRLYAAEVGLTWPKIIICQHELRR